MGASGLSVCVELISGCSMQLLLDHQDAIAPEHNDPIHELLDDLGEVPTIESLIGKFPLSAWKLRGELGRRAISVPSSFSALSKL